MVKMCQWLLCDCCHMVGMSYVMIAVAQNVVIVVKYINNVSFFFHTCRSQNGPLIPLKLKNVL